MVLEQATAPFPQDPIISIPSIVVILQRATQSDLSRQRDVWLMSALGSVRDHNASLKASFQLQIPALIQLVSFEDTLIMGSRRADGVVNNTRIHWAEGTLSEFISSWLPVGPLHQRRRRRMVCVCLCVLCCVLWKERVENRETTGRKCLCLHLCVCRRECVHVGMTAGGGFVFLSSWKFI